MAGQTGRRVSQIGECGEETHIYNDMGERAPQAPKMSEGLVGGVNHDGYHLLAITFMAQ